MKTRHERIKKLRTAWNLKLSFTDNDIAIVTHELLKTSASIDQVACDLGVQGNFVHRCQDISLRYLVRMVELKNVMLEKQEGLKSKRMAEARNERMCEIIEEELKLEIEKTQLAADLRAILELLVDEDKQAR